MRYFHESVARARQVPFHLLIVKICFLLIRKIKGTVSQFYHILFSSYSREGPGFEEPLFLPPDCENIKTSIPGLSFLIDRIMNHEFNLLGSGWQKVSYGVRCQGLGGFLYGPYKDQWSYEQLKEAKHINASNRSFSKKIVSLIKKDYEWIDWQRDFKSGYRWQNNQWWGGIPYGHKEGVDIKVPWELSRMQHLPLLAYAYGILLKDPSFLKNHSSRQIINEFESQILDFIANNPPGFGVNWKCPMDVAIRGANWSLSLDLFRGMGAEFSKEFLHRLSSSLCDHGRFVFNHFEKGVDFRGNHYLANIAGLAFMAFYLKPSGKEILLWRETCFREIKKELSYQFHDSGTNFEGSTAYHRLSAEMIVYPIILFRVHPDTKDRQYVCEGMLKKIAGMSFFSEVLTKPNGKLVQIGDNDSGRFFKLNPVFVDDDGVREDPLDVSHVKNVIKSFFTNEFDEIEGEIISRSLKKTHCLGKQTYFKIKKDLGKTLSLPRRKKASHDLSKALVSKKYFFTPPGDYHRDLRFFVFSDFGVVVYRNSRFFLSFRCGPVGQLGRGGHDHNDQLSIELFYNDRDVVTDPGTFLYTPAPGIRNAYRSNSSHFCPQPKNSEMGNLNKGLFFIEKACPGSLVSWDEKHILGYSVGFGFPVYRRITLGERIIIEDFFFKDVDVVDLNLFKNKPYSQGYGLKDNGNDPIT